MRKGIGFGFTSGIITTLGLIVGLNSSTGSQSVVIGGILIIAIADALSDALGIHISEEAENKHTHKEIWEATICTFLSKFFFSAIFIVPFLLLPLQTAIVLSVVSGLLLIVVISYFIGREQKTRTFLVAAEHVLVAIFVIIATHYIGQWVATIFS